MQSGQSQITVFTDRKDSAIAYIYNPVTGDLYLSNNYGQSFSQTSTIGTYGKLSVSPGAKGDLWLASGGPLQHSTDGGLTWTNIADVTSSYSVGFGKEKPGTHTPAIYLYGQIGGITGFFRSTDYGGSFIRINDDQHQYGDAYIVAGDSRVYGRIFIATNGLGIVLGDLE